MVTNTRFRQGPFHRNLGSAFFYGIVCVQLNHFSTEATKAREKLSDAERSLNLAQKHLEEVSKELVDLFNPSRYGVEGQWKKLHNTCLTKNTGE
jgi:protein kinase C substrate 80K-H